MGGKVIRSFFRPLVKLNWKLGLLLILLICIPRFYLVLQANVTSAYNKIGYIMMLSALVPFVLLSSTGLKEIGIKKPEKWSWLFWSLLIGAVTSLVIYFLGEALYGDSIKNWYVYIGRSYQVPEGSRPEDFGIYFMIFMMTGMTFSPIGEEFFFRGIVHGAFANSYDDQKASWIDAGAFALTHLAHFGIVYVSGIWQFLLIPSLIWVSMMLATSFIFIYCKNRSGSIWGAVTCHAGFNGMMIYSIFYWF